MAMGMLPMIDPKTAATEVPVKEVHADLLPDAGTSVDRRRGLAQLMGGLSLASALAVLLGRTDAQGKNVRGDKKKKKKAKAGPAGPPGPPGPQGPAKSATCPSDTTFFAAVGCVEDAMRPAAQFGNAITTCGGIGRRLLTTAELNSYRQQPGVTIGEDPNFREWTGTTLANSAITISDGGSSAETPFVTATPFRCMTMPSIV
jgi:hypothetical protein